jgi:hypothetical protein
MRGKIHWLLLAGLVGAFTNIGSSVVAGDWDRAVGPARTVETAARELRRRLERINANRYSIDYAFRLERTAGELINVLRFDYARPNEVQYLFSELTTLHNRVQNNVQTELRRRNDHTLRAQADHLARRVTELQLVMRRTNNPLDCDRDHFRDPFAHDWEDYDRYEHDDYRYGRTETYYYRPLPGNTGYGYSLPPGIEINRGGTNFQGSIQTRNGRYSFNIGR